MTTTDVVPGAAGPEPQEPTRTSLGQDRTAMTFWAGESISLIGSQVTAAVLPLLARESLGGSGLDIGLLQFFLFLPYLALPLLVGVWVDRHRKRPLMISTNLIRLVRVLAAGRVAGRRLLLHRLPGLADAVAPARATADRHSRPSSPHGAEVGAAIHRR
ncbi:hypothetical protein [Kineosporia corallincola]|uniref:hypothetical protein n=1 Tax=Kineosporia corallincola TaxID=2835133 RepID=UPI001FEB44E1|nr:hypothetical protein [Kineosporia corallincola]